MDFTNLYIQDTYQKVIHIGSGSYLYDGTGSFVSPKISGSITVVGDISITSGSIYNNGNVFTASYTETSSYALDVDRSLLMDSSSYVTDPSVAYTNAENRFTGSQYINADVKYPNTEGSNWAASLLVTSTYTGSNDRTRGLFIENYWSSSYDVMYNYGAYISTQLQTPVTSSVDMGLSLSNYNQAGYSDKHYGIQSVPGTYNNAYSNQVVGINSTVLAFGTSTSNDVKVFVGRVLKQPTATVINECGLYLYGLGTAVSSSYAIYTEDNVPSFHSGSLILANTASYQNDYSSFYNDRTLVDKGWVDSITGSMSVLTSSHTTDPFIAYQNQTNYFTGSQYISGSVTVSGSIRASTGISGMSAFSRGLTVNNLSGDESIDNFIVNSNNYTAITVSASEDSVQLLDNSSGKIGFLGATPTTQSVGWDITNVITTKMYDSNNTNIDEISLVLGTLINELKLKGLIG